MGVLHTAPHTTTTTQSALFLKKQADSLMMSKNLKFFPFLLSTPPLMTIGTLKEMEKCEICILESVEVFPQKFGLLKFPLLLTSK